MNKQDISRCISALCGLFLFPVFIAWLWKLILVPATGVLPITYWQAFGLRFLIGFLVDDFSAYYYHKEILEKISKL